MPRMPVGDQHGLVNPQVQPPSIGQWHTLWTIRGTQAKSTGDMLCLNDEPRLNLWVANHHANQVQGVISLVVVEFKNKFEGWQGPH
ncbi:hypothetical protein FQN51_008564 [Onygenales sp. PD_10]|nr:hypothetical protein FQN51_008564 [Onygenales sp. PD_10]